MNAKIICIGDELLQGITLNTNSAFLAEKLTDLGLDVEKIVDISDNRQEILNEIAKSVGKYNIVVMTGGLGPTSDDITKHTLLDFFGGEMILDQNVLDDVNVFLQKRQRQMNESNRQQAFVPSSCKVIRNKLGTAPGMIFERQNTYFIAMPGVPFEMEAMFSNDVVNFLQAELGIHKRLLRIVHLFGIPEAELSEKLSEFEKWLPEQIRLAYLPSPEDLKLKFFSKVCNNERIREIIDEAIAKLQQIIGEYIWGYDKTTMEQRLGELLSNANKTICTAESCTGGYLSHKITSISGSSQYFKGGVVVYSNELKRQLLDVDQEMLEKYGAVSSQTVEQMARNARQKLNTDYAIAISGIAGPTGGTIDKPVGTVFIGIATPTVVYSKKFNFGSTRLVNIRRSAAMSMFLMIKELENKCI